MSPTYHALFVYLAILGLLLVVTAVLEWWSRREARRRP